MQTSMANQPGRVGSNISYIKDFIAKGGRAVSSRQVVAVDSVEGGAFWGEDLASKFAEARSEEEILDNLFTTLRKYFAAGAIVVFRNRQIIGWHGYNDDFRLATFPEPIRLDDAPEVISEMHSTHEPVVQLLDDKWLQQMFLKGEGFMSCALPFVLSNKIIGGVVLVDKSMEYSKVRRAGFLIQKACMGLELQILRKKILSESCMRPEAFSQV